VLIEKVKGDILICCNRHLLSLQRPPAPPHDLNSHSNCCSSVSASSARASKIVIAQHARSLDSVANRQIVQNANPKNRRYDPIMASRVRQEGVGGTADSLMAM
jgi:hypothetical protein